MKTNRPFWSHLAHFLLEWEMFQTKPLEVIKTHFMFNNIFFSKIVLFMMYVEKYCITGQATDDNVAHAHCMLIT